jgi:5-methyltetrahydropteroyltriglutamate--homocysteine methyltransferase
MIIENSVAGCLPRPQGLIEATRRYDRSQISEEELEVRFREYTKEVIAAQEKSGLSYINDGFLRRQDLLRPFTTKLEGVIIGQLNRWFDNNTFYRIPIIKDEICGDPPYNETYSDLLPKAQLKALLPAPYTFVKLSKNEYYRDELDFLHVISEILNHEIRTLEKQGYTYFQLSDPALVYHKTTPKKDTLHEIAEAIKTTTKGVKSRTCLQTFFGDISSVLDEILDWKIDDVGIDYYETELELIKEHSFEGGICLGVVDSRNTLRESSLELYNICRDLISAINIEHFIVSTNCDLDFLTWDFAQSKITTLVTVASKLREEFC